MSGGGWTSVLRRRRREKTVQQSPGSRPEVVAERRGPGGPPSRHRAAGWVVTLLACLLAWAALTLPDQINRHSLSALVRIPLEGLLAVAVLLVLPRLARAWVAVSAGVLLALLAIGKILDTAFFAALGRPFSPVSDGSYFRPAVAVLEDAIGRRGAVLSTVAALVLGLGILVLMPLALLRIAGAAQRHRRLAIRTVALLVVAWTVCALAGVQVAPNRPVASTDAARLASDSGGWGAGEPGRPSRVPRGRRCRPVP